MGEGETRFQENSAAVFTKQEAAFLEKFGRRRDPGEPLFFDPDADTPKPMARENTLLLLREACDDAGLDLQEVPNRLGWGK